MDTWLARVLRVTGWVGAVFWGIIGLVGLGQMITGETQISGAGIAMPLICALLAFLNGRMILYAKQMSALIKDFRLYCAVFAREPDKSIADLALALNTPVDTAMDRLQSMCRRGYFNGFIDFQQKRMQFAADPTLDTQVVTCPGCGASGAVTRPGQPCRYCGSPLHR